MKFDLNLSLHFCMQRRMEFSGPLPSCFEPRLDFHFVHYGYKQRAKRIAWIAHCNERARLVRLAGRSVTRLRWNER
jgi:hypothetical protein